MVEKLRREDYQRAVHRTSSASVTLSQSIARFHVLLPFLGSLEAQLLLISSHVR